MSQESFNHSARAGRGTALLAAFLLAACDGGSAARGASSEFSIDGAQGTWKIEPGSAESPGDAQFHRHGVATAVQLSARDGGQVIELFGSFLGEPSDPMFIELHLSYDDGAGNVFEHAPALDSQDSGVEGMRWRELEIDHDAGTGRATVEVDIPACVDVYSGPIEYETRCHQVTGSFDTPLVHNPGLRVVR